MTECLRGVERCKKVHTTDWKRCGLDHTGETEVERERDIQKHPRYRKHPTHSKDGANEGFCLQRKC